MKVKYLILVATCLLAAGCADTVTFVEAPLKTQVGFWHGLWHGMIFPVAWIVSLFSESTSVYAIYNNGGWYDFGFALGISSLAGGSSSSKKSK